MIDWSLYAHDHEIGLAEIQSLSGDNRDVWGWSQGMFIAGTDDFIALRFWAGKDYEPVTRALWRALCVGAELVVDVGSHSGVFTLDAWRAGAKQVISVEPHPINYSRLVMNLRKNNFPVNGVFYGAAGLTTGVAPLLVKGGLYKCHAAGRMGLHNANGIEIPTRVAALDDLIKPEGYAQVRAIKIDAENWTPDVLRGAGKILAYKPDLIVECIASGMEAILAPLGYRFWRVWETGKIEEVPDLAPHNPGNNYNGTDENCRNRFCSVRGLSQ